MSDKLIHAPNRQEFLQTELKKINKRLPAAVYIPFVNDSMRNYAILHIVADESRVFQTKERAPVLLHFEAFRPEELMLSKPEQPLSFKSDSKRSGKGGAFKSTTDFEYENHRSASWDSSSMTKKDKDKLKQLQKKNRGSLGDSQEKAHSGDISMEGNPYEVEKANR